MLKMKTLQDATPDDGFNAALTEIETKKKAWFD